MTENGTSPSRRWYVLACDTTDRALADRACLAVLDIVRPRTERVTVDAYSDYREDLRQTARWNEVVLPVTAALVPAVDGPTGREQAGPVKLKLDLHDIYNRGEDIDRALRAVIAEAVAKKAPLVEIIPGKGSGQLKKRVLRFLDQKEVKALYHRVEKDSDNFGRVFVHFRWK